MPHKNNPRYNEQIHAHRATLAGYTHMAERVAGEQWWEGDVSHSATRRIYLPGIHLATDAIYTTMWYILNNQRWNTRVARITAASQPEMKSGRWIAALMDEGIGREQAYEATRQLDTTPNDLPGWPLGDAPRQTADVVTRIRKNIPRQDQLKWRDPS